MEINALDSIAEKALTSLQHKFPAFSFSVPRFSHRPEVERSIQTYLRFLSLSLHILVKMFRFFKRLAVILSQSLATVLNNKKIDDILGSSLTPHFLHTFVLEGKANALTTGIVSTLGNILEAESTPVITYQQQHYVF